MKDYKDYYEVLGVSPQASQKDVKERFRFLSHAYHPDKFATPSQKQQAEFIVVFKLRKLLLVHVLYIESI